MHPEDEHGARVLATVVEGTLGWEERKAVLEERVRAAANSVANGDLHTRCTRLREAGRPTVYAYTTGDVRVVAVFKALGGDSDEYPEDATREAA